jgi:hypothetical protein
MTTEVNVQVTVREGARAADEPDHVPAPAFRHKVVERGQVVQEVLALLLALVYAGWCMAGRMFAMIAEWRAKRRQARRLVVVIPAETDAWIRAYAERTGRDLGEIVHDAIGAARSPETFAALCQMTSRQEPIIVRIPQTSASSRAVVIGQHVQASSYVPQQAPTLAKVASRAVDTAIRRLGP